MFEIIKVSAGSRSQAAIKGQRQMSAPQRCCVVVWNCRFWLWGRVKYQSQQNSDKATSQGYRHTEWFVRSGSCQPCAILQKPSWFIRSKRNLLVSGSHMAGWCSLGEWWALLVPATIAEQEEWVLHLLEVFLASQGWGFDGVGSNTVQKQKAAISFQKLDEISACSSCNIPRGNPLMWRWFYNRRVSNIAQGNFNNRPLKWFSLYFMNRVAEALP